jgi:hypothetical protein
VSLKLDVKMRITVLFNCSSDISFWLGIAAYVYGQPTMIA